MKNKLSIYKAVLINLIAIIGFFYFGWEIFEVAFIYILETFAIFFVFFVDRYFIVKETRYPFGFALVQLFFLVPTLGALLYSYTILVFMIAKIEDPNSKNIVKPLNEQLGNMNLPLLLGTIIIIEAVNFYVKKRVRKNEKPATIYWNLQRLLIIHMYVILSSFAFVLFPFPTIYKIIFIIGFKVMVDFAVNDELFFKKLKEKLKLIQQKVKGR